MNRGVLMNQYLSVVDDLITSGCMVRLHVYDGIGLEDTIWTGRIVISGIDKETEEGYISFAHIPSEAKRLQCDRSYLFFPNTRILSIDVLSKDFDELASFECPHCGAEVALEGTIEKLEMNEGIDEGENKDFVEDKKKCSDFKNPLVT